MVTLGTAYVQIVPSAQGISGKIKQVLEPEARSAGESSGRTISSSIGRGLSSVGGKITSCVTKPVLAAGTALGGLTLAKGWSRMVEIDNARAKLTALGQDAKAVQESANEAVTGTAYSLNKAMTTAASAVAAGIEPGEKLTRYLTNIADASAVAGIDMDEMGAIFNKVATNGKMSAEELNQLSDRGIPVMQLLSKTTGKSMDEVREAISNGEIGIEELQAAIEEGMDGAAKSIGSSTISGAISNLNASIGRIGANFLGSADDANSIAGKILPLLNAMMDALGGVEEKAKTLGTAAASFIGPAIDRITNMLSGGSTLAERAQAIADRTTAKFAAFGGLITSALGPALLVVGKGITIFQTFSSKIGTIAKLFGTTSGTLMRFAGIFGLVVSAFIIAYRNSESFRMAINQLVSIVGGALKQVFTALSPLLKVAVKLFAQVATVAGDILGKVLLALMPIITKWVTTFTKIVTVVAKVATAILSSFTKISGLPGKVTKIFNSIKSAITSKIESAKSRVSTVIDSIRSKLSFSGLAGKVKSAFDSVKSKITGPIKDAKDTVSKAVKKIEGLFPLNVGKIMSNIRVPKINISKGEAPYGLGGKGRKPSISVTWNKKAMENPYLFSNPTLFGAGEAGDEVLYGRKRLLSDITEAVDRAGSSSGDIVVNLNYDASDDAADMLRDLTRGVRRYRMAGVF